MNSRKSKMNYIQLVPSTKFSSNKILSLSNNFSHAIDHNLRIGKYGPIFKKKETNIIKSLCF